MSGVGLPGVGWLYLHEVQLVTVTRSDRADTEGRTSTTDGEPRTVRALVALADVADVQLGAAPGTRVDAVARVEHGTTVAGGDRVVVSGVAAHLDGTYRVDLVRPNPVDLRLMLVRYAPGDA